jgi:hypothetical protein
MAEQQSLFLFSRGEKSPLPAFQPRLHAVVAAESGMKMCILMYELSVDMEALFET